MRILSASNKRLDQLVADGLFREDLFYRLNVFRLNLPALKDRKIDLPLLIRHILRRLCAARGKPPVAIATPAMELLLNFNYPGNVRELENILEHALIICQEDKILPTHLPEYLHVRPASGPLVPTAVVRSGSSPDNKERDKLLATLQRHNWHRKRSARALGMDRTTLWRKMKKYGLLD